MRTWIGGQSPLWPEPRWQVYALPTAEVRALAATYRPVLDRFDELSPVADTDLHMTVQPLPGSSSDYPAARLNSVHTALRAALATVAPVTVTAGPALCSSAGVVADVDADDDHPLAALFTRVHRTVRAAAGEPPPSGWPGHVSLAYARGDRDSGDIQSPLRRTRTAPIRATWTIDRLHLVEVHQDSERHTYSWPTRTALEIPLGGHL